VLTPGRHGGLYLVPAYQFSGQARFGAAGRPTAWFGLTGAVAG